MRYYTANKSRSQGRGSYSIIFRHPVKKDSTGKSGLRIRRGLGTSNPKKADKLVNQMNDLLRDKILWSIDAKPTAAKIYDPLIISAFYDILEIPTKTLFIVVYESELGKGWELIDAVDEKDVLNKFKEIEPSIYKLCKSYGIIHIAKVEKLASMVERSNTTDSKSVP